MKGQEANLATVLQLNFTELLAAGKAIKYLYLCNRSR